MQTEQQPDIHGSESWQIPAHEVCELAPRRTRYCIAIPVINEGERILSQLRRMQELGATRRADVLLLDGGSTDGSTDPGVLRSLGVRALLVKRGPGRQAAQLRMGWAWALHEGYEGIVTVDGNGKDGVEAIPAFLECLDSGFDFVQGSRHLPGGAAIRTPWMRRLGIALVHVPLTRIGAGYPYTDTTNAFRAYSRRLLLDSWVQPFRDVFMKYELLAYMSIRAPRLGFRVTELPVRREYPASGEIPTKISSIRGNWDLLRTLWRAVSGKFDPPPASNAALL